MNWGNRLLLVFVVFGSGISYMVYRCMEMPVDLVSKEYYKEELAYQHVIDGTHRADALSSPVRLVSTSEGIHVLLPAEMKGKAVSGLIRFYCPSAASHDRDVLLAPDAGGGQMILRGGIPTGNYTVSVSWECGGIGYFNKQPLAIH